ncbi:hypothetical protein N8I77_013677 [Diaporthe amygdali]|uniref:Uncharacterized protein n=1 Tax=Phomopsis amygdali TaxID=1214568 RepID=A0AAD9S0S2_PHOAM|nr:hypothetical protein N8I77_013677 [Diaporthe amygdali]
MFSETTSESQDELETPRLTLDNVRTPYDEDEIVGLVTELYELLVKLAYIGRDHITWPPSGGHAINEDSCRELQVAPEVISLLKRLPYIPWDEDPDDRNPDGWELERPDDLRYYRNYYPQHAPSFFRRFLEKIETLEVIPSGCEQFERQYYGPEQPQIRNAAMRTLIETYGWLDGFRQVDWKHDVEGVWVSIIRQALD